MLHLINLTSQHLIVVTQQQDEGCPPNRHPVLAPWADVTKALLQNPTGTRVFTGMMMDSAVVVVGKPHLTVSPTPREEHDTTEATLPTEQWHDASFDWAWLQKVRLDNDVTKLSHQEVAGKKGANPTLPHPRRNFRQLLIDRRQSVPNDGSNDDDNAWLHHQQQHRQLITSLKVVESLCVSRASARLVDGRPAICFVRVLTLEDPSAESIAICESWAPRLSARWKTEVATSNAASEGEDDLPWDCLGVAALPKAKDCVEDHTLVGTVVPTPYVFLSIEQRENTKEQQHMNTLIFVFDAGTGSIVAQLLYPSPGNLIPGLVADGCSNEMIIKPIPGTTKVSITYAELPFVFAPKETRTPDEIIEIRTDVKTEQSDEISLTFFLCVDAANVARKLTDCRSSSSSQSFDPSSSSFLAIRLRPECAGFPTKEIASSGEGSEETVSCGLTVFGLTIPSTDWAPLSETCVTYGRMRFGVGMMRFVPQCIYEAIQFHSGEASEEDQQRDTTAKNILRCKLTKAALQRARNSTTGTALSGASCFSDWCESFNSVVDLDSLHLPEMHCRRLIPASSLTQAQLEGRPLLPSCLLAGVSTYNKVDAPAAEQDEKVDNLNEVLWF